MNTNDPQYVQSLAQAIQQQRNQANDAVAHLAALNALKDQQIATLTAQVDELKRAAAAAQAAPPAATDQTKPA